jgi:hypothetical protein
LNRANQPNSDNETSDWNTTPRAITKQLLFTPSILDPNSFDFISFANEPPSYYKFTPGRTNTLEPPQTRDLHNSNFFMDLGTPLSIPTPKSSIHVGQPSTAIIQHGFPQHALASYIFQNTNPFALDQRQQSQYQHLIEGFVSDVEMQDQSPVDPFGGPSMDTQLRLMRPPQSAEKYISRSYSSLH